MRTFWILFRTQMRNRLGLSALRRWRTNRRRMLGDLLIGLCALVGVGSVIGLYAWMLAVLFGAATGPLAFIRNLTLLAIFALLQAMTLLLGTGTMLGTLYFGRDAELLASLPVGRRTVFASKFAQVLAFEYVFMLAFGLPPVALYAQAFSLSYVVRGALVLLLLPLMPLTVSALLSLVLMRVSALIRHREALMIGATFAAMLAVFLGQMLLVRVGEDGLTLSALLSFLAAREELAQRFARAYPPAGWALRSLGEAGAWGSLVRLAGTSLLGLGAALLLAGKLYAQGLAAAGETATRRGRGGRKTAPRRPQLAAIFLREWRIALRTPAYATNGLASILMAPLMVCMMAFAMPEEADEALQAVRVLGLQTDALLPLGLAALLALIASINTAGVTAFSREGAMLDFGRSMPVRGRTLTLGKQLFGASIALLAVLAGVVAALAAWRMPPSQAVYAAAVALAFSSGVNAVGLTFDLYRPRLNWVSPMEAIKQGLNPCVGLLAMLLFALFEAGGLYLTARMGAGAKACMAVAAGMSLGLCALSHAMLLGLSERLYVRMGDGH